MTTQNPKSNTPTPRKIIRQKFSGQVVKIIDDKTAKVRVESIKVHPLYGKRYKRHKNYLAHTDGSVEVNQAVMIESVRPISKKKRWRIITQNPKIKT